MLHLDSRLKDSLSMRRLSDYFHFDKLNTAEWLLLGTSLSALVLTVIFVLLSF